MSEIENNWWDQELKVKIMLTDYQNSVGEINEGFFKLCNDVFDTLIKNNNEDVKQIIKNHLKKIHSYIYSLTLVERWMENDFIETMVANFYFTATSSLMPFCQFDSDQQIETIIFDVEDDKKTNLLIQKIKRKAFVKMSDLYIEKIINQLSVES